MLAAMASGRFRAAVSLSGSPDQVAFAQQGGVPFDPLDMQEFCVRSPVDSRVLSFGDWRSVLPSATLVRESQTRSRTTMLRLRKPAPATIEAFLKTQATSGLSYAAVGATAGTPPAGYDLDRARVRLGDGPGVFRAAKTALGRWEHFRLGWCEAWPADTPIKEGEVVAVLARVMGLWWLNAARIVYVVDREASFGFAYGTLPGHAESGEERFMVEWDHQEGGVWYDLLAFSRPQHLLARLGYPLVRRVQERFRKDSAAAMRRAVGTAVARCS
jgi:uncharacterized protein (UPF0548 family)